MPRLSPFVISTLKRGMFILVCLHALFVRVLFVRMYMFLCWRKGESQFIWSQLVYELVEHCVANETISGRRDYDALGRWIYSHYPCIKREGSKPWVS